MRRGSLHACMNWPSVSSGAIQHYRKTVADQFIVEISNNRRLNSFFPHPRNRPESGVLSRFILVTVINGNFHFLRLSILSNLFVVGSRKHPAPPEPLFSGKVFQHFQLARRKGINSEHGRFHTRSCQDDTTDTNPKPKDFESFFIHYNHSSRFVPG